MPNPRAQRPLSLQAVTEDIRSLAQPAQAMLDMLAGAAKGSVSATAGIGGDLESLARGLAAAYRAPSGQRMDAFAGGLDQPTVLPTTQNISDKLPAVVPATAPLSRQHTAEYGQGMGEFIPTPGSGKVVKGGLSMAGQALNDRLLAGQSLTPFLNTPAPITHVIKPKGGNWMTGSVEKELNTLKRNKTATQALEEMERVYPPDVMERMSPETRAQVERAIPHLQRESALNNWVDRNLTNFVKKEMATPEDPVRKLAEQGITHYPVAEDPGYWARHGATAREERGGEVMAQSPLAKQWENRTDAMIDRESAQQHQDMMHLAPGMYSDQDAWIKKLDPSTQLYSAQSRHFSPLDLGFDHILDVLREDLAAGRIRPEQLNKVSMEQAVRRTYEYDQEMAKKMREAAIKQTEGMPVHKEYPEGYKWIELARPKDLTELPKGYTAQPYKSQYSEGVKILNPKGEQVAAGDTLDEALKNMSETRLEEALKYEGETMGHCVGGYCPDVMEGRSRIYSLRDAKGEPHVTVEVNPRPIKTWDDVTAAVGKDEAAKLYDEFDRIGGYNMDNTDAAFDMFIKQKGIQAPESIAQIKGKQNAAPKEQYLPYVQDFVRGGQWSDVGDLKNTGLQKFGSEYLTPQEAETKFKPMVADALSYLEMHPSLERHRAARQARNDFKGDLRSPEYRQLEREAGESIAPDVPYTYAELKALLSSPEDWTDRGDTIYTPISTALEQIERARQHLGPLPPTEGMKRGGKVHISDNPDTQMMELAGGGLTKLAKLARAPAKSKEEIRAVAERMAPQMTGEFVRGEKGTQSVAGKTQKQFAREKELQHDIRGEMPVPGTIDYEKLKDQVAIGIAGDPTITGKSVYGVAGEAMESPSPQHGGPLYGLGRDDAHFWASQLGAAKRVQNLAREAGQQYDMPVLGQYIMMGPESINYAQHFADANLSAINPAKMTKRQIEGFNKLIRQGSQASGPRPGFPGIENKDEAYLQMAIDPELRKHFNALMQMPTVTERFNLPSGIDVRHAVTEPALRDLETGVTGYSVGQMKPEITELKLSSHPTYSHDIPGHFLGQSKYPIPYEIMFPDTLKAIRENPKQAPHEFGSLKMVGPRQQIDQQMIDEIKMYEEMMKGLTGKKKGGQVKKAAGGEITANDLILEERKL